MTISLETLASLTYGQQVPAGLHVATVLADMDFETYSEAGFEWNPHTSKWVTLPGAKTKGLGVVGVRAYVEHPTFEVLSLKFDLKDGHGVHTWVPGMPNPQALFDHIARGLLVEAWNAGFEMQVWERCTDLYGWPAFPVAQIRCAMAKSRAHARPGKLEKAAEVMHTLQKDGEGDRLLKKFSVPQNPTQKRRGTRILPSDEPHEFQLLLGYNETDIKAEAHASINTPDLLPIELEYWQADQAINRRGVHIDVETLQAIRRILAQAESVYNAELEAITGGIKPTQLQQLKGWCSALGCHMESMDEDAIDEALKRDTLHPSVRRALEIRSITGSASVKKAHAMLNQVSRAGRLHDLFSFHAARTGRPTGNGPQPTNIPKAGPNVWRCVCGKYYGEKIQACPWCSRSAQHRVNNDGEYLINVPGAKAMEWSPAAMYDAIEIVRLGDIKVLEFFFGDALLTVAGCLRGMFNAAPGHVLISSDYTAIEAVVLACLAGEQWRIDLFKNKGKIYESSGSLATGIPLDAILAHKKATGQHHPARQSGKVLELMCGFQGWVGAWYSMLDQVEDAPDISEDEIKKLILAWREKSPAIVEFWGGQSRRLGYGRQVEEFYGVEGTFIKAILQPGEWHEYRGLWFIKWGDAVYIRLLSGRYLTYHNAALTASDRPGTRYAISFWGWNTNPNNGPVNRWIMFRTWGGRITENIVQATANDILRYASVNLERAMFPVVLHVYDEIVAEVPTREYAMKTGDMRYSFKMSDYLTQLRKSSAPPSDSEEDLTTIEFGSVQGLEAIMKTLPAWAILPDGSPWPIGADGGWIGDRYRKG